MRPSAAPRPTPSHPIPPINDPPEDDEPVGRPIDDPSPHPERDPPPEEKAPPRRYRS